MPFRHPILICCLLLPSSGLVADENDFEPFLKPLFAENCTRCHGGEKLKAKVNLKEIATVDQLLEKPELLKELIEVIDAYDMPPEDEPELPEADRTKLLASLKNLLGQSVAGGGAHPLPLRRLNRFQYNNAIVDLFQLDRDVFHLSENLMTRQANYLTDGSDQMPDKVNASCLSLQTTGGLKDVGAFPKDVRPAHGFDNQANQLTLSPLLLDSFLKLSVSILESPDFNEKTVGVWNDLFAEPPPGSDIPTELRARLARFLELAFRGPVEQATLDRYVAYTLSKLDVGTPFTESMKKVISAALSSPLFLYRYRPETADISQFQLASNLSFFLWGSTPDFELLRLAHAGELSRPDVLEKTVTRMFADPKIERFLDSFPGQWMQLENVLAATPDPNKAKFFKIGESDPASLHMVLEPLLLFDAVFVEGQPIAELISPPFSYQSEFLKTWYSTDLKPPPFDPEGIASENRAKDDRRTSLTEAINRSRAELDRLTTPAKERLLADLQKDTGKRSPVDLKPYAAWEFEGDLKDSVGALELKPHGNIRYEDGMVVLDNAFLQSGTLPFDLNAKSLEIRLKVPDVNQSGGGAMAIQGPGDFFDAIVLGERKPRHWISGSNGFRRTMDFPESTPEETPGELIHLVMVYQEDGTTALFRNGIPYGKPYKKGQATFPKDQTSILFGLRHLPAGKNKFLSVSIDEARFYNRALTPEEVAASAEGGRHISEADIIAALTPEQRTKKQSLTAALAQAESELKGIPPNQDPGKVNQNAQKSFEDKIRNLMRSPTFERVTSTDPRYGGVITNAAMLSMTSGPDRTHPIARGAWLIEVIFNDPPPPPPNDVPPLNDASSDPNQTIREKFAVHRENPTCAGCHSRLDPLGFALENYDITGRWRDKYENGRDVDASGTLMRKYEFAGITDFKSALLKEDRRIAKAFAAHLLRFALARELLPADWLAIDEIVDQTEPENFRLKSLMREVIFSAPFQRTTP